MVMIFQDCKPSKQEFDTTFNTASLFVEMIKTDQGLPVMQRGLCFMLTEAGRLNDHTEAIYSTIDWLFLYDKELSYLSEEDGWSEIRMNALAMLAVMDSSDFV